jgi:hypothetical protein
MFSQNQSLISFTTSHHQDSFLIDLAISFNSLALFATTVLLTHNFLAIESISLTQAFHHLPFNNLLLKAQYLEASASLSFNTILTAS